MDRMRIGDRGFELASLPQRWFGQFLDAILYGIILYVPILVLALFDPSEFVILWGALPALAYLLFQDGLQGGQSLGKKMLGIRVLDAATGRPCSFGQSFVRNASLIVLNFIDWIFIFGDRRQRLGDKLVNTVVVRGS